MEENHTKSKAELLRRYLIFGLSLLIIAFGISIITRSDLGTSPITSVPYVASLNTPPVFRKLLFPVYHHPDMPANAPTRQKGIMERKMELLMQFPVAFVLSVFTDLTMWITACYIPQLYYVKLSHWSSVV